MRLVRFLAAALAFALLLLCSPVFAEEVEPGVADVDSEEPEVSVIDSEELSVLVDNFISEKGLVPGNISIGFNYVTTGESWFYNGDEWFYPGSMYKIPMMMVISEMEREGELSRDTVIAGITLETLEEYVLVYSNNDYAHVIRHYLGGDSVARPLYKRYSSLPDDYYSPDFVSYGYFTARYMNDVMLELYTNSDKYPYIMDCLIRSLSEGEFRSFYRLAVPEDIEVAQKYGSLNEYNSNTGIIFRDNPIILTVMTRYTPGYQGVIADIAALFCEYSDTLDLRYGEYLLELEAQSEPETAEADSEAEAEARRQAALEQQRKEEEALRLHEEQQAAEAEAKRERLKLLTRAVIAAVVILVLLGILVTLFARRYRKLKRYRMPHYDEDMDDAELYSEEYRAYLDSADDSPGVNDRQVINKRRRGASSGNIRPGSRRGSARRNGYVPRH